MTNSLKSMGTGVLSMISDETGVQLATFMKTYLNSDSIVYNESNLTYSCSVLCKALNSVASPIISIFTTANNNMTRLLDMHYPEVTYALLLNS